MRNFNAIKREHLDVIGKLDACSSVVEAVAQKIVECLERGGKVCFMGNGGSAADSQHLAAEFVGRFQIERNPLPSMAFTTDTSILTAIANDYGYDSIFERQVQGLCSSLDVVVGISTSGNSPNVLRGLAKARDVGAFAVGLTGESGGKMLALCDACIRVPSPVAARIQEAHILIGHALCEVVENALQTED
ncbi:MAG: D-sedoheptulose 7-phosphate isomerase [Verrucomicrobiales bacterium]